MMSQGLRDSCSSGHTTRMEELSASAVNVGVPVTFTTCLYYGGLRLVVQLTVLTPCGVMVCTVVRIAILERFEN